MATHTQQTLWEFYEGHYADLIEAVRQDHISHGKFGGGHDFTHALMVARYAVMIADQVDIGLMAWAAAICHNTDRIWPDLDHEGIEETVHRYLSSTSFTEAARKSIIEAVLEHHKLNDENDSPVTMVLKDADRLANIGPNNIIRSGQLYNYLPAYDPRYVAHPDPEATYKNPKTNLHDVLCSLEWEPWLRCPKAIELAKPYFDYYRQFKDMFVRQMVEVGFLDEKGNPTYPFPEDLELAYQRTEQEAAH